MTNRDERVELPGIMKARAIARLKLATLIQYPSYDRKFRGGVLGAKV